MNIQEYISSGIVESYVLGLASNEEQREFEQLCAEHAALRQAKEAFERSLEQQAVDSAVPPPASIKNAIWNDLNLNSSSAAPAIHDGYGQAQAPVRSMNFSKLLAAASIVLLVGSTLLNFHFYSQYRSTAAKLDEYIASNQQLAENRNLMQARLQEYEQSFQMLRDTNMAVIAMKGQPVAPQSFTTVYWNRQTRDVYLLVNSLPRPAAGKQYQLWALVDGKPVDAGVLNTDSVEGLVKMKNIQRAQAFAITLENAGGSKAPTMPIYIMGQI